MGIESVIDDEYVRSVDARLDSYSAYIEYQIHEAERALPFLARFGPVAGARVLEIGAGRGGKGIAYACAGMRLTALDVDVPALELGQAAARERGADIHFLAGDGTRLPFPNARFDAVLLDSVIEHVRDPQAVLVECARVCKPGGMVFIVFPPFYGPLSGHIDDYVSIPWFHLLPRELVKRRLLTRGQPMGILTPAGAYEVFASLNGLTIWHFRRMARRAGFRLEYVRVRPFLTHPGTRLVAGLVSALRRAPRLANVREVIGRARREFDLGTFLLFILLCALVPLVFIPGLQEIAAGGFKCILRKPA